jgi:hypothetical protein
MRKTKSSQILYLCLFFFFLACFLFISQCFFVNFTPNSEKRREKCRERVSNRCFSMKNYTTVLFFSFPFFFFLLEYLFYIIVVLSFYIFFYLYFRCLCFFILFWSLIFFLLLFFNFLFFFFLFYINQFPKKTRERVSIHCFSVKNYTIVILFFFSPITIIFNFPVNVSQ